ncbi:MAG: hypothetical protein K2X66_15050 [Cyanobacteria bacterium]|nr:hypothetical protein [Cyanobacteriota bacterium]
MDVEESLKESAKRYLKTMNCMIASHQSTQRIGQQGLAILSLFLWVFSPLSLAWGEVRKEPTPFAFQEIDYQDMDIPAAFAPNYAEAPQNTQASPSPQLKEVVTFVAKADAAPSEAHHQSHPDHANILSLRPMKIIRTPAQALPAKANIKDPAPDLVISPEDSEPFIEKFKAPLTEVTQTPASDFPVSEFPTLRPKIETFHQQIEDHALVSPTSSKPEPRTDKKAERKATQAPQPAPLKKEPKEKAPKLEYAPLESMAIIPVVKHHQNKAFGDLSILFSDEFANTLSNRAKGTQIYNPVYFVEEIKIRGLQPVYQKMIDYYNLAHRPENKALSYILKELSNASGKKIERVAFVEVDLDVNHSVQPTSLIDRFKAITTDDLPKEANYFIKSRIQVFDTTQDQFPMIWGFSWSKSIPGSKFYNFTPSVFQDSDSIQAFSQASRWMSRELLLILPKKAYAKQIIPEVDTEVKANVIKESP